MTADVIDWSAPWLAPYQATALEFSGGGVAEALNARAGFLAGSSVRFPVQFPERFPVQFSVRIPVRIPVRFVPQSHLPDNQAYEQFIFDTQSVPTRDNLHDFFNGLCWLTFPQTKKKLNQLQAEQLALGGVQPTRGPVRDALTLFDENAAFLLAPQPLWDALIAKDWQRLFVELRPMWAGAQLVLFGHALLEKLVNPRKPITAHVYRGQPATDSIAALDAWIAADITADKLASKPFAPLPVLGVPGWCAENEKLSFYEDILVFRHKA